MKTKLFFTLILSTLFQTALPAFAKETPKMNPLKELDDFQCRYADEHTHGNKENELLYNYAYWHELHGRWPGKNIEFLNDNLRYFRIAAANGDTTANLKLQSYLRSGKLSKKAAPDVLNEVLDLNDKLLAQNVPAAYYRKSRYIRMGMYRGSSQDADAYLRKAADLGDKDAQYDIGQRVEDRRDLPAQVRLPYLKKFWGCAAMQGHSEAGHALRAWLYNIDKKQLKDNIKQIHNSAKGGGSTITLVLELGFITTDMTNRSYYIGLNQVDKERSERYRLIRKQVAKYSHLNPQVPDLDKIVPLPPAKLPAWDGKIEFVRWYEGPAPAKPSEELMRRLAAKHHLDPDTGLPLDKRR